MTHSNHAISLDLSKHYKEAINEYELAKEDDFDVNLSINLSFLYWLSASEFAWADAYGISKETRSKGIDRCNKVLDDAKSKFPECAELYFWEKYFRHRLVFDPFTDKDTLIILSEHAFCKEAPYFFLYLFDKTKYKNERNMLLDKCIELPTAKNLYIQSIIGDEQHH